MLAVSFLAGCGASAEVNAVRDPNYARKMHKLHAVIAEGGADPDFALELDGSLRREFQSRGVGYSSRILTGLELDQHVIEHDLQKSPSDGVLLLRPTKGTTYYGEIILMSYDASLLETEKQAVVWRGRVNSKRAAGAYGTVAGMMEETASSIVSKIEADGLLARAK